MPRFDTVYNGGDKIVTCGRCHLYLTNNYELISTRFQGSTGKASLYYRVWNIRCSEIQRRDMMTGQHLVRDVECMRCEYKLGWMYEYAVKDDQKYKEMRVILEKQLISEEDGIYDHETGYNGPFPLKNNDHRGSPESSVLLEPIESLQMITFPKKN